MNRFEFLLKQARKAVIYRDFDSAEKILCSQEVANIAGKDNPRILFALGNLYHKAENFDKALSVFHRLNALQPQNTEVLNRLGTIYRRTGQHEKSLDVLLKARSLGDNSAQLLYNLGNTYKEMHSYSEAEECFAQALELNPDDTLAYNHIGTIEFLLGHYKRAFNEYRNGLRIDPNHPFIHFNMARLYRLLNRNADSEREYIAALKSLPNWQKALKELASLYNLTGSFEKQAAVLDRLLMLNGTSLPALLDSAENAWNLGKPDDAHRFFQKALSVSKNDPLPAEKYARFLSSMGEFSKAAEVIEAYNEDNPQDKSLMLDLAELYLDLMRYSDAKKILEEYDAAEDDPRALQLLAKMHLARGDRNAAQQCLKQIISGDPGKIKMRKELASLLAEAGLLQEAREQLKIYLKDNPEDLGARVLLGAIYEQEGDFEKALACYTAVIEKEKDNMRANVALSLLYQRMGKNADAVQLAGKVVNAQSAKTDDGDLSLLRESLELYEQAVDHYRLSNPVAAAENLRKLARIKNELKSAAESALQAGGLDEEADILEDAETIEDAIVMEEAPEKAEQEAGEEEIDLDSLLETLNATAETTDRIPQDAGRLSEDAPLLENEQFLESGTEKRSKKQDKKKKKPAAYPPQSAPQFIQAPPVQAFPIQTAMPPLQSPNAQPPLFDKPEATAEQDKELAMPPERIQEEEPAAGMPDNSFEAKAGAVPGAEAEAAECDILGMLKYLKETLNFLPEEVQGEYRQSRERLIMEYVISKLSGRPGLRENSIAKSAYEKSAAERSESGEDGIANLRETFSLLANLSAELPDKDFGRILEKQAKSVQERLIKLEKES